MKTRGLVVPFILVAACSNQDPSFTDAAGNAGNAPSGDAQGLPTQEAGNETEAPVEDEPSTEPTNETDGKDAGKDDGTTGGGTEGIDKFTSKIQTNGSQTVTVDSFYMNEIFPVRQQIDRAAEPLKSQRTQQALGSPRTVTKSVLARGAYSQTFTKKPPLRYSEPHTVAHAAKPVDIFVTVDDSESFGSVSIGRAKAALRKVIQDLYDTDWVLYLGGLEGVGGNYDRTRIAKGSMTLAAAQAAAETALTNIFAEGSLGDERVFRSLNRLAYDYRTQDRDGATHLYLVITDAPNCKDRNNAESGTCQRQVGRDDHHTYLMDTNTNLPAHMRHMSLFGAYFRMTDNAATCGNADGIELPLASETLKLQSQYAEASFQWERLIYPATSTGAAPSWVGDLCSTTESMTWLTSLTDATKDVAARRFRTVNQPDTFAFDPSYDLKLTTSADVAVSTSNYLVKDGRVLILNPSLSGAYKAVYHLSNDYRKTDYPDLFTLEPAANTVELTWSGGAANCVQATTFTGLDAGIKCRHTGRSLYLRDVDFLPTVLPGQAAVTVTARYENKVEEVTRIDVTAGTKIHLSSVGIGAYPASSASLVASATKAALTGDGKSVRLSFASALPPGDYRIDYFETAQTAKTLNLNEPAVAESDAALCVIPSMATAYGLDANGDLYATPSGAIYPCTLSAGGDKVSYDGFVPNDPTSGQAELVVIFKGYMEPVGVFALDYPPRAGSLSVTIDGGVLAANAFTIANNQLQLEDPLMPGESMVIEYEFWPPLKSCFPLSGVAFGTNKYFVWYGPLDNESSLEATSYTITKDAQGKAKICLDTALPDYGRRLVVGYISDEKKS